MPATARVVVCLALVCTAAWADRAIARDGGLLRGAALVVDAARGVLVRGKREFDLEGFYLVEHDDGALVWSRDFTARLRGYETYARILQRDRAAALVPKALKAKDLRLAERLLDDAERYGFAGKAAQQLHLRIEHLIKRPNLRPGSEAGKVREQAAAIATVPVELLVARARSARVEPDSGKRLLREALRLAPRSPVALALLQELAPSRLDAEGRLQWLDWTLDVLSRGAEFAPRESPRLRFARATWRRDLLGVQSKSILLITPVRDSHLVGRCLAVGQLTSRALAALFSGYPVHRKAPPPMTVFLFSSQEEYRTKSGRISAEEPAFLEWTAGHYSPEEKVSRFFWHKDRDAERRIIGTCVHELTHQWLRERCPAYSAAQTIPAIRTPGFWIVEGFATFMEEGSYDIDSGRWSLFAARSRSLDVVAALAGKRPGLVAWPRLYSLDQEGFHTLSHKADLKLTRRWSLGYSRLSDSRAFYEQAAATCHYLFHAEKGAYRKRLLDYIVNFYTGERAKLSIPAAFGMSAEELGRRVEAFARKVEQGWRPKR